MADPNVSSLTIDMRPGETITLAGNVVVQLVQKSGRVSRLRFTAPRDMEIKKQTLESCESRDKHAQIASS